MSQSVFRPLAWPSTLYFVIALCVLMQSNYIQAQCIIQGPLSCNVYNTCFDRYCPCTGADNYFISYGRKYCDRFLNERDGRPPANNGETKHSYACRNQLLQSFPYKARQPATAMR